MKQRLGQSRFGALVAMLEVSSVQLGENQWKRLTPLHLCRPLLYDKQQPLARLDVDVDCMLKS